MQVILTHNKSVSQGDVKPGAWFLQASAMAVSTWRNLKYNGEKFAKQNEEKKHVVNLSFRRVGMDF
jgi:hypothetical protein